MKFGALGAGIGAAVVFVATVGFLSIVSFAAAYFTFVLLYEGDEPASPVAPPDVAPKRPSPCPSPAPPPRAAPRPRPAPRAAPKPPRPPAEARKPPAVPKVSITRTDDVRVPSLAGEQIVGYAFVDETRVGTRCPTKNCRHDAGGRTRTIWARAGTEVAIGTVGPRGELHPLVNAEGRLRLHRGPAASPAASQLLVVDHGVGLFTGSLQRHLDLTFPAGTAAPLGRLADLLTRFEFARYQPLLERPDWRSELPADVDLPERFRQDATRILKAIVDRKLLEPFRSRFADEAFGRYRVTKAATELILQDLGFHDHGLTWDTHILTWGYLWAPERKIVDTATGRLVPGVVLNAPVSEVESSPPFTRGWVVRA